MNTEGNTPLREAVETNWDAVTNAFAGMDLTESKPAEQKPAEKPQEQQENTEGDKPDGDKPATENTAENEAEDLKAQAKELGLEETATKEEIEAKKAEKDAAEPIKIELGADVVEQPEPTEGSWFAVAKEANVEIAEDSFDAFKEALVAPYVKQLEETKALTVDNLFSTMKPETVAAFKLMEMGIPEDQLFHPTREIEKYLAFDNAELVRADKEAMGWKPEMIDPELELLTEKNLLGHEADKIRLALNGSKENILKQREDFIQQYESKRQDALLHQKEEERNQFTQALNTVSTFMGANLKPDLKDVIIKKFNSGAYDDILNSPQSKVEYVLHRELHDRILKSVENTAFEKGKNTVREKQLVIPPVTNNNAGQQQKQPKEIDNWAAAEKAFGA